MLLEDDDTQTPAHQTLKRCSKTSWLENDILGTLSSGNADGDGDAETCEKTRERTPLWWKFTNIKQHRRDRGFGTAKLLEIIDFRPRFQIRMTSFT